MLTNPILFLDNSIKVWNIHTGELIHTLIGHEDLVRTLQFDGTRIISGSYDESIKIWDLKTGQMLLNLKGHTSRVFKLQFNDARLVSCSNDQHVIVWDFTHGLDYKLFV